MNKQTQKKRLVLAKESLRTLAGEDVKLVAGGCGAFLSAMDCSGAGTTNTQSVYCSRMQW